MPVPLNDEQLGTELKALFAESPELSSFQAFRDYHYLLFFESVSE